MQAAVVVILKKNRQNRNQIFFPVLIFPFDEKQIKYTKIVVVI